MELETRNLKPATSFSPLISVIVPVYNAEKTLRQCIDSILSQEFKDFELLLIDDGSRDQSPAICDDYAIKDDRVRAFHKPNRGVSSARNLGLDHAQGIWVVFVDSDDYISNNYFRGIEKRKEDIIFLGYKTLYGGRFIKDISISEDHDFDAFANLINHNINNSIIRCPWAKFYRRESIANQRFNLQMRLGEDACFVFEYISKCKSYHVKRDAEYIVIYCGIPDQIKYSMTVKEAARSLSYIKNAFDKMAKTHNISHLLFLNYIGYFKRVSQSDWLHKKSRWYCNRIIIGLYWYVWRSLSFKQKLSIVTARMAKR